MNDRVTITSKGGVIGAVLLNNGWREVLHGQLLDDNHLLLDRHQRNTTRRLLRHLQPRYVRLGIECGWKFPDGELSRRRWTRRAHRNEEKPPLRVLAALPQRRRRERGPRANLVRIGRRAQTELSGKAFPLGLARITDAGVLA